MSKSSRTSRAKYAWLLIVVAAIIAGAAGCPSGTRLEPGDATPAPEPVQPSDRDSAAAATATETLGAEGFDEAPLTGVEEDLAAAGDLRSMTAEALNAQGVLGTVYFGYDSFAFDDAALAVLAENAAWLRTNPRFDIIVEGHCDDRGSTEYNLALGSKRANAIRDHLVRLGVDVARIGTKSFGEEQPAVTGSGEDVWAKNRRAEFILADR